MRVEILMAGQIAETGKRMLKAMAEAIEAGGDQVSRTQNYAGRSDVLMLWGVGKPQHDLARRMHLKLGGRVVLFDLGYFGDRKHNARLSIDHDHPQALLDAAPDEGSRWTAHNIRLLEHAEPQGPILLIGLGRKSRIYLRQPDWERKKLKALQAEFQWAEIIFRPKTPDRLTLPIPSDETTPIDQLLAGASLAVCRHSNVAVDAAIAGVPFRCEDGAAMWLQRRPFTRDNRLQFLQRLAWFQWSPEEAAQCWAFTKGLINASEHRSGK